MCHTQVWEANSPHLNSKKHFRARTIMSHLDRLMGQPLKGPGARPYGEGTRFPNGVFKYEEIQDFWGKDLLDFGRRAKRVFSNGVMIKSKRSRPSVCVPPDAILGCSVGIVNYAGPSYGKYSSANKLRWPHTSPHPVHPEEQFWPILLLFLEKSVSVKHSVIFDEDKNGVFSEDESEKSAGGSGVVCERSAVPVSGPGTKEKGGDDGDDFDPCNAGVLEISEDDASALPDTPNGVWAVCAYQATAAVPTAWPLKMRVSA
jgi:hypothetical protein